MVTAAAPARTGAGAVAGIAATASAVRTLAAELAAITTRPWTLMEVCGGQTHAIVRWGLDQLLPPGVRLIHGPGCPVCVTPAATIEQALLLARRPELILCSYGDMLRVPGEGHQTLLAVRAAGADVRLLTAPLQALELAQRHHDRQVVFLAVGFETTAPATALLARQALAVGIPNLSLLDAHVRVSPAMQAILAEPGNQVQAFLAAGHVCSVLGTGELQALVSRWQLPVVVSGFAPLELMAGILACVRMLEAGAARVENAYGSVVRSAGNPQARRLLEEVFEPCDRPWRGLGLMPGGGLALRGPYRALSAHQRFELEPGNACDQEDAGEGPGACDDGLVCDDGIACDERVVSGDGGEIRMSGRPPAVGSRAAAGPVQTAAPRQIPGDGRTSGCIAGAVLMGQARPPDCSAFGTACRPERPLGAPMVSSEGACAAYFHYRGAAASRQTQPLEPVMNPGRDPGAVAGLPDAALPDPDGSRGAAPPSAPMFPCPT